MTKTLSKILSSSARFALILTVCMFSFNAYTEDESNLAEPVPSCVKVCSEGRSGKASRGCPSICLAAENTCAETGGIYEFQSEGYVCSSAENIGIAKK